MSVTTNSYKEARGFKPLGGRPGCYPAGRALRFVEKSVHDTTSGCCLSRALRWRSVMPPHTPNSTLLSSASAPHSVITGQRRQITAASRCLAPRTNSASGSVPLHSAFEAQARSSAATPLDVLFAGTRLTGRAGRLFPDNELSFVPADRKDATASPDAGMCATSARTCEQDPPAPTLSDSVSNAQQFFGTRVPFLR